MAIGDADPAEWQLVQLLVEFANAPAPSRPEDAVALGALFGSHPFVDASAYGLITCLEVDVADGRPTVDRWSDGRTDPRRRCHTSPPTRPRFAGILAQLARDPSKVGDVVDVKKILAQFDPVAPDLGGASGGHFMGRG